MAASLAGAAIRGVSQRDLSGSCCSEPLDSAPSTACAVIIAAPIRSIPRLSSSMFVVRGVIGGDGVGGRPRDMWLWNVAPWRRLCAEAGLRATEEATAPPTYLDGRPKRRARELRVQDKGFAHPDSAPNAFTLEEWRVMTAGRQQGGQMEQQQQQQRQQELLPMGVFPAAEFGEECLHPESAARSGDRKEAEGSPSFAGDSRSSPTGTVGLLDPGLFDADGQLFQGDSLVAAQSRLERKEQRRQEGRQQERDRQAQQLIQAEQTDSGEPAALEADELASRDGWDWKVGPSSVIQLASRVPPAWRRRPGSWYYTSDPYL